MCNEETEKIDDGGAAKIDQSGNSGWISNGDSILPKMTLRDYFFCEMMKSLIANPKRYEEISNAISANRMTQDEATAKNINKALLLADAMLAARK